ncbi:Ferredoxin--NADP(+) reductase [Lentibacillus sp. JNUCC-1]|nr:Ferredoxin--NADP(+) reductase [Lentibacillus sp. JNUCC-1]
MKQTDTFDVTIIGGGAAGLFAAFYSGLRSMSTKIIETTGELGGKMHVYPEKMVWDVGGLPPLTGADLIDKSIEQGLTFDPTVVVNETVTAITKTAQGHFVLETASGERHYSRTVIIAIGSGILDPHKLEVEGLGECEAPNIHYAVQSLKDFKDKTVLISGGGNTAIDWANELERVAKHVYLIYRGEALGGHEAMIEQLLEGSVEFLPERSITNIQTNSGATLIKWSSVTRQPAKRQRWMLMTSLSITDINGIQVC